MNHRGRRPITIVLVLMNVAWLSACVSTEPAATVPHINLSPESVRFVDTADGELAFGIDATANESDSLENLTVLPGVKVRRVRAGSAADRAGLRSGDVILNIDGVAVNSPGTLSAIASQTTDARTLPLTARRGTTVFDTELPVPDQRQTIEPEERYRIDPTKTRAGYRTVLVEDPRQGKPMTVVRIVEILPDSPLASAGLRVGDAIARLDGDTVTSAQALINTIHENYDFGETIAVQALRANNGGLNAIDADVQLWDPGRRLSELALWPLFTYRSELAEDRTRFSLLDLWVFSLFAYERNGGEKSYTLLGIFEFATGYGELVEASAAEDASQ